MTAPGRLREGAVMALVAAICFGLLVYVGWGEGKRTYPRFVAERMLAQAELVRSALDSHLLAGLPLRQFPGFRQIADPIRQSDPGIAAIAVYDTGGTPVFVAGENDAPRLAQIAPPGEGDFERREDAAWLQIALPLRSRFETVGELTITMPRQHIAAVVDAGLPLQAMVAAGLALLFGVYTILVRPRAGSRIPWVSGGYGLLFAGLSAVVLTGLVGMYADGVQSKAKALTASLGQRIAPAVQYGLAFEDFRGLDDMLMRYRRFNPDIEAVAMMRDGTVMVHTDPAAIGRPWQSGKDTYDYIQPVGIQAVGRGADGAVDIRVAVSLPVFIVWQEVLRSVKNFAALFVASALLAGVFFGLGRALQQRSDATQEGEDKQRRLALIKPVFFIAIFIENLSAGFLPQLLRGAAVESGWGQSAASAAFTAYFAAFLLVLMPVSAWVDRHGPRGAVLLGAGLAALASLLPVLSLDYSVLLAARGLAGLGQGLLFIGVQAAVLANAPAGQRTQAAAIIVFGFNGGMIAGAAIGSLLVDDITATGVFAIGAVAAALLVLYASHAFATESVVQPASRTPPIGLRQLLRNIPQAFADADFLRAFLLIGAPAKAVLTGVVAFAMPLLLNGLGWAAEDIGQVIMLYAGGVLLASGPVARLVDGTRAGSGSALVAGGLLSAIGLGVIGMVGLWPLPQMAQVGLIAIGIILLGLAHGCINAPVITYIGSSGAAGKLGANGAMGLYRVVERAGHVLGPLLAGQILLLAGGGAMAMLWIGGGLLAFSLLFAITQPKPRTGEGA